MGHSQLVSDLEMGHVDRSKPISGLLIENRIDSCIRIGNFFGKKKQLVI